jgi:TonB family protein
MEVVVRKDGTVGDLRVTRSLDATYGLDAEAIAAAKQWAFKPAMRRASPDAEYEPVNVYVTLQLMFRLNDNRAYFPGTPGLVAPVLLSELKVAYTAEARQHHIEGDVIVEARVEADGHIGAAEIAKSLDKAYGLDDAALAAVRALMFTPATLDGSPVAAFTSIDVAFKLE